MTPCSGRRDCLQQSRQIVRGRRQRRDGARDRVAVLGQAGDQLLQLVDAGVELRALLVDRAQHGVEVVDHVADQLVAGGQALGERAGGRPAGSTARRPGPAAAR